MKRILILDDDRELCEELAESIRAQGCFVDCATDANEGHDLIRGGAYDMILLDFKMQELTGVDILKKLKADHIKTRIFIITGRPAVEETLKEENLQDMISGVITKPIDFKGLFKKIEGA